ncbi:MAG: hypothetical protein QFX33_00355 [Candidatus Nezhaarchaeota archaeon]|nr:hypothetical protein [Candidatus Nezhaarchaeota archaeon]
MSPMGADTKAASPGVPLAIMLNGYGTWLWVLLGFVALLVPAAYFGGYAASISAARQAGDALGALAVTLQALPVYASAFLLINVLVATLSTGGYGIWAGAMSLVYDVLMPLFPKISDKRAINLIRLVFVVGVLLGAYGGNLPSLLVNSFIFAWAMTVPLFIIVTAALKWRRNSRAALWTIISSWLVAILWLIFSPVVNQTLPSWLHPPVGVIYPVTIIGVMVYVALTLVWSKETKPSLLAEIPQIPR